MPAFQLEAMLLRIGLALGAGVLIAIVPIAQRKARYEPSRSKRVILHILALIAFLGFCAYAWYLWDRYIPRAPEAPAPVSYPVSPAAPTGL
jgi:hypothetical protein